MMDLQDELERDNERLREKLSRQKKSSKTDSEDSARQPSTWKAPESAAASSSEPVCDICERPGHDVFDCDLLKDDVSPQLQIKTALGDSELYCEDCEEHGHVAANCPHSQDVF